MAKIKVRAPNLKGYPTSDKVARGCRYTAQVEPSDVFLTCTAQLHNLSKQRTAAVLQVLKINTLAGQWMLRDIREHKPEQRFTPFRKPKSTKYVTDKIHSAIESRYREHVRSRYTLNSYIFGGLCTTLASMTSSYLQKVTEARQKGLIEQYEQCARYQITFGKHKGDTLGSLGRKTIFGYAFITPRREQCEEALRNIAILLNNEKDDEQWNNAAIFKMAFGPHRNRELGTLRETTLNRIKLLVERDLQRADMFDELRTVAQSYLKFTPPSFPNIRSQGLTPGQKQKLEQDYIQALEDFGYLSAIENEPLLLNNLAEAERQLFRELQRRAYAATNQASYIALRWNRADGCVRHRECALVYDPVKRRYLFLAYLLADGSRHKQTLTVDSDLYDVNNPGITMKRGRRPSTAMLFELEFDAHQQEQLDHAREQAHRWKDKPESSGGCIRSATLHAQYSPERKRWWFEVHLSVGFRPSHIDEPRHIIGVHVDPVSGWYATVLRLDGTIVVQQQLDEHAIAVWLNNKHPEQQAQIKTVQRTAKERHHRMAGALAAMCYYYQAQIGVENIKYRRATRTIPIRNVQSDNSRTVVQSLLSKLALVNLPRVIDVGGVAPKRDCSQCGIRHAESQVQEILFVCEQCNYSDSRYLNTSREIARRVLWVLARKNRAKPRSITKLRATKVAV